MSVLPDRLCHRLEKAPLKLWSCDVVMATFQKAAVPMHHKTRCVRFSPPALFGRGRFNADPHLRPQPRFVVLINESPRMNPRHPPIVGNKTPGADADVIQPRDPLVAPLEPAVYYAPS